MKSELLSFIILTYNQEKTVEEAVNSALNQTYNNLEIILSDDCSQDKTYEIIERIANDYKGPHKLIINRNKNNLGISKHFNLATSMAKGELFIMGAGDDISLPHRVETLYSYWYPQKNDVFALNSNFIMIDEDGKEYLNGYPSYPQSDIIITDFGSNIKFPGCSTAYSRKLFECFDEIKEGLYEDIISYRRALLLGKVQFIAQKLLKYRLVGITSQYLKKNKNNKILASVVVNKTISHLRFKHFIAAQIKTDIEKIGKPLPFLFKLYYFKTLFGYRLLTSRYLQKPFYLFLFLVINIFTNGKSYFYSEPIFYENIKLILLSLGPKGYIIAIEFVRLLRYYFLL